MKAMLQGNFSKAEQGPLDAESPTGTPAVPIVPPGPGPVVLIIELDLGLFVVIWREQDGRLRQRIFWGRRPAEEYAAMLECRLGLDALREEFDRHAAKNGQVQQ